MSRTFRIRNLADGSVMSLEADELIPPSTHNGPVSLRKGRKTVFLAPSSQYAVWIDEAITASDSTDADIELDAEQLDALSKVLAYEAARAAAASKDEEPSS